MEQKNEIEKYITQITFFQAKCCVCSNTIGQTLSSKEASAALGELYELMNLSGWIKVGRWLFCPDCKVLVDEIKQEIIEEIKMR